MALNPLMDERIRRQWAASEASLLAWGDPMSPLRWTLKSTSRLAAELTDCHHPVSARKVAALLKDADYSLQGNRKKNEGGNHVDRNAQFRHINQRVTATPHASPPRPSENGGVKWAGLVIRVRPNE